MVEYVLRVGGVEVLEDRHYCCSVGYGSHECDDPSRGVFAYKRYFVAALYPGKFKCEVHFGYSDSQIAICESFVAAIFAQSGESPVVAKTGGINFV